MILTNDELDAAVAARIMDGTTKSENILREVSKSDLRGSRNALYRPVDRALQRLRKRGVIAHHAQTGWQPAKKAK